MRKTFTFIFALLLTSLVGLSQNSTVGGIIDVNTTWSGDTIFVDEDVIINDDITLTIDPGVVVIFNDFYKIDVQGTILAEGTEGNIIEFTVLDTTGYYDFSHTGWDGIDFDNNDGSMDDNDESVFDYCAFYFGKADSDGGAIYTSYFSKILIENSLFKYNYASTNGGAINIQNEAEPVISKCDFIDNSAYEGGGAINIGCYDDSEKFDQAIIKNCYFANNKTWYADDSYYGGGALKISGYSDAYVYNNIFENNSSLSQGGAMITSGYSNPFVVNNLFVNNTAEHNGGAIGLKYYAGGYFINNTIVNNYSGNEGGAISIGCDNDSCYFANNIIGGNSDLDNDYDQFYINSEDGEMKFYNNDIEGGLADYTSIVKSNNIDEDPLFVDEAGEDFSVESGSPVIDAGITITVIGMPDTDLLGNPRIAGDAIDLGAIETVFSTGIRDANSYDRIGIYPNPSNGIFTIEAQGSVEILNINGQVLKSIYLNNDNSTKVDISEFKTGVYLVRFKDGSKTQRIIKL